MGRPARVPLRLRRPDAAPARRGRDARPPRRRLPSRSRTSPAAPRSPGGRRPSSCSSRWPSATSCSPTAPSTTPPTRATRCTTSSAGCSSPAPARRPPNGAVRLLEAGGERAEAELVAAEILELTGSGVVPEDIAVLVRGGAAEAGVLGQVLEGYGIPVSLERRIPLGRTRLGAGVLAGARAALPGGTAADVLTWLRTPGRLADPEAADALEAHVRRAELTTAAEARERIADDALVALADARRDGGVPRRTGRRGRRDLDRAAPARGGRARPRCGGRRAGGRRASPRGGGAARPGGDRPGAGRLADRAAGRARRRAGARAARPRARC